MDLVASKPTAGAAFERLRELVRRHRVCWEASTEGAVVGGALRPIGFNLELIAVHDHPAREPTAGCPECAPVLDALEEIAAFILPVGAHASRYEVHVLRRGLRYSAAHARRPEVVALIQILHRAGINAPIDECEESCLHEMTEQLRLLGAKERAWGRCED